MPSPGDRSHHPDYGRLTAYLKRRRQLRLTLTFAQLEEILLGMLPWAARFYLSWWSNGAPRDSKSQARAWLDAGWRVAAADQVAGTVVFERGGQGQEEL
jgi:hypothetical protein